MKLASPPLRLILALCLALPSSCATSHGRELDDLDVSLPPQPVRVARLPGERLQLEFEPAPLDLTWERVDEEEIRAVLADFLRCTEDISELSVVPAMASPTPTRAPWDARLRAQFLARYGPIRLPLPGSLQHSPLYLALKLSPRYMGAGFRDAARELFRSPLFIASVALSIVVYFAAWLMPEPLFSKSFAAALTARLALAVGLLELRNVALAVLQLYREAQAAKTMAEIEAVAERFGRALGGTALRVLVMVASFGIAKALPNVPPGGLGPLLSPPRFAVAGGLAFQASTTAQVVTDGTLVLAGAAVGTVGSAVGSVCTDKMDLDDPENLVYLANHQGPHPEEYHKEVYERLETALFGCHTVPQCKSRFVDELRRIRSDVCTRGSFLHRLLTKP